MERIANFIILFAVIAAVLCGCQMNNKNTTGLFPTSATECTTPEINLDGNWTYTRISGYSPDGFYLSWYKYENGKEFWVEKQYFEKSYKPSHGISGNWYRGTTDPDWYALIRVGDSYVEILIHQESTRTAWRGDKIPLSDVLE